MPVKVAITGTPGVGKTTVGRVLRRKGYDVLHLNRVARELGALLEEDEERQARVVDVHALERYVREWEPGSDPAFVESHYAHLMPVDLVVVLRLHPRELERRLREKGYSPRKISENLEAEFVGVCYGEAVEVRSGGFPARPPGDVIQLDVTGLSPEEAAERVLEAVESREGDEVDWLADEEAQRVIERYLPYREGGEDEG
ncbi:MAG: adenylate kinase family protein [Methanopyraceae archaeon]